MTVENGTAEQRLELAIDFFGAGSTFGTSSTAIIETLVRGADELTDSGWWAGMGTRPSDWGDAGGNIDTLAWLPTWAKPQAAAIISESIMLVHERYPDEKKRDQMLTQVVAIVARAELLA